MNNIKKFRLLIRFPSGLLVLVLLLSFAIRIHNLNYNSPFLDEAQYLVLGRKIISDRWEEETPFSWVGGMPLFYPTLSAIFGVFGVVGARFLNVVLGAFSVYLMFLFGRQMSLSRNQRFNEIVGLISAFLLGILAIPIYLSRIATYDMLSFTLFLLGLVLLQKAFLLQKPRPMKQESRFFMTAFFLFLAFLAKYITLIFIPFIAVLASFFALGKNKATLHRTVSYFTTPLFAAITVYIIWNLPELRYFVTNQIKDPQTQTTFILNVFLHYTGVVYVLACFGGILLLLRKKLAITFSLLAGSLLVPIVHIIQKNSASIHQHTFLSIIFLTPMAAYFCLYLTQGKKFLGYLLFVATIIFTAALSRQQLSALESSWDNSSVVTAYLKSVITPDDIILAQEDDVVVLDLPDLQGEGVIGPFDFEYQNLSGPEAYTRAVSDGYFNYIQLTEDADEQFTTMIKDSLLYHYTAVYSEYPFVVFKRSGPSDPLVITFIPYWDQERATASFQENVGVIDEIFLFWYALQADGSITKYQGADEDTSLITFAKENNVKTFALFANLPDEEGDWDPERVDQAIRDSTSRSKHIDEIISIVEGMGFDGVDIDYENLREDQTDQFTRFIQQLAAELHKRNKRLQVAVYAQTDGEDTHAQDLLELSRYVDELGFMTYDEHYQDSSPGPIASIGWLRENISFAVKLGVPKQVIFLGIPLYGYDWSKSTENARGIEFDEVSSLIRTTGASWQFDEKSASPYFEYANHIVWFENAASVAEKIKLAKDLGLGGISLWRVGREDPKIWEIIR